MGLEPDRRRGRKQGGRQWAAVEKPEEERKPERFFGNRNPARSDNPEVVGSNPSPATTHSPGTSMVPGFFLFPGICLARRFVAHLWHKEVFLIKGSRLNLSVFRPTKLVYQAYLSWCKDTGRSQPVTHTKFTHEVCKATGYFTKTCRVALGKDSGTAKCFCQN